MPDTKLNTNQLGNNETVWTESSLRQGKNIELVQKSNPYLLDENVVFHLNFENGETDSITVNTPLNGDHSSYISGTNAKFGNYCGGGSWGNKYQLSAVFADTNCVTIDFWFRTSSINKYYNQHISYVVARSYDEGNIKPWNYTTDYFGAQVGQGGYSTPVLPFILVTPEGNVSVLREVTLNQWYHVAAVWNAKTKIAYLFVDGELVATKTLTAQYELDRHKYLSFSNQYVDMTDEIRVSNVCRLDESDSPFTEDLPDEGYKKANGEYWYVINHNPDSALDATSKNSVQNKVVKAALDTKLDTTTASSTYLTQTSAASTYATQTALSAKQDVLTSVSGYDSSKTQVLKQVQGTLMWVDAEEESVS